MPARLAQQEDENGMMEAACPQAVRAGLANSDGVGHPASIHAIFLGVAHASAAGTTRG
jgi:hypothetical protein